MLDHIEFLQKVFFGNTLAAYLGAVIFFAGAFLVLYLVNQFILTRMKRFAEKTETRLDDFFIEIFKKMILPLLYVGAVYFALQQLVLSASVARAVTVIAIAAVVFQVTRLITVLLVHLVRYFWIKSPEGAPGTGNTIISILKVIVWGIAAVFLLDNMGFNISAVVAGLGIGGVAIALAAQTILGDLFNYFVIFFDKPFEEGDFVIVDEYLGVIEHVGIKTTRIRSLGGEQIVFSNSDLAGSRLRNYKRMQKRRVLFKLGVTYQTSKAQLERIPGLIREIIGGVEETVFDRAHFSKYGDFNLEIEIVYYVLSSDYNRYMDIQQAINLKIKEVFEKEKIEFAYPTQTLFVNKS